MTRSESIQEKLRQSVQQYPSQRISTEHEAAYLLDRCEASLNYTLSVIQLIYAGPIPKSSGWWEAKKVLDQLREIND